MYFKISNNIQDENIESFYFSNVTNIVNFIEDGVYVTEIFINNDSKIINKNGKIYASNISFGKTYHLFEIETWKYLIENGANINTKFLFCYFVSQNYLSMAKYLISLKLPIIYDFDIAIKWAARNGHLRTVKYLSILNNKINIDSDYAVRWSLIYCHLPVSKYLISLGGNIHAKNDFAFRKAISCCTLNTIKYIMSFDIDSHINNDEAFRNVLKNENNDVKKFIFSLRQ